MRLLITGGSGYIGNTLCRRAPAEWTVAATYLTQAGMPSMASALSLDVRDPEAVDRLISGFAPDVVIHTAARVRGDDMNATNAQGSRHVASAAARVQARLIHLSTDALFDGEHAPYYEDAPPSPITAYGRSKALAEAAVRAAHPHPMIVRTSLVYGFDPIDPRTQQTLAGEMPRLYTDEFRCPVFVDDLADALLELAALDYGGVLHIAGPRRLSRFEFGVKLAAAMGVAPRFEPAEIGAMQATSEPRPRDCTLVISRAQRLLRTRLRSVDEVIERVRETRSEIRR